MPFSFDLFCGKFFLLPLSDGQWNAALAERDPGPKRVLSIALSSIQNGKKASCANNRAASKNEAGSFTGFMCGHGTYHHVECI